MICPWISRCSGRALWLVSRYWADHLQEHEGLDELGWREQKRGLQQHFAVLLPYLTARARRSLEAAVVALASQRATRR